MLTLLSSVVTLKYVLVSLVPLSRCDIAPKPSRDMYDMICAETVTLALMLASSIKLAYRYTCVQRKQ